MDGVRGKLIFLMIGACLWFLFGVTTLSKGEYTWSDSADKEPFCKMYSAYGSVPHLLHEYTVYCDVHSHSRKRTTISLPQCEIGFTRPAQKITHTRTRTESCTIRGLNDRPGLWKAWTGVLEPSVMLTS